jgi:hypothetical protein
VIRYWVIGLVGIAGVAINGCHVWETHEEDILVSIPQAKATITCSSPFTAPDLSSLKECGDAEKGKGHCYDGTKVPITIDQLAPCDDGKTVCVPDSTLTANGKKGKACTFTISNTPGACQSLLLKDVYANKDILKPSKPDGCDDDERCLPCIDPRNNQDTTLCNETGAHESACTGGTGEAPELCCHWMGECVEKEAVPENIRSSMKRDTCSSGSKVCAPTSQIESKPVKCDVLGEPGVCLDECFLGPLKGLSRSSCGPTERCMPCALANLQSSDQKLIGCE